MSNTELYEILGITKKATFQEIKEAYRKRAKEYHPDVNEDEQAKEKFAAVKEAYDILSDKEKRTLYDKTGMKDTNDDSLIEATAIRFITDIIKDLFKRAVVNENSNILRMIKNIIDNEVEQTSSIKEKLKNSIASLKKIKKNTLKKENPTSDVITMVLDQFIRDNEVELYSIKKKMEILFRVNEILDSYEFTGKEDTINNNTGLQIINRFFNTVG